MSGMKAFSALAASERSFFSYLFISLFLRVVVARVEVPIRPGRVHGGSGRCPNPTGRSVGCGGLCRCPNPTGRSVGCGGSGRGPNPTSQSWVSSGWCPNPTGRYYSGRFCSYVYAVFGPSLYINRVNSLLLINIRRTTRFRIFQKKLQAYYG